MKSFGATIKKPSTFQEDGTAFARLCHDRSGGILCSWSVHRGGGKMRDDVGNLGGIDPDSCTVA